MSNNSILNTTYLNFLVGTTSSVALTASPGLLNIDTTSVQFTGTQQSASETSGALVVSGGTGILSNFATTGPITCSNTTVSTSVGTGALIVTGGVGSVAVSSVRSIGSLTLPINILGKSVKTQGCYLRQTGSLSTIVAGTFSPISFNGSGTYLSVDPLGWHSTSSSASIINVVLPPTSIFIAAYNMFKFSGSIRFEDNLLTNGMGLGFTVGGNNVFTTFVGPQMSIPNRGGLSAEWFHSVNSTSTISFTAAMVAFPTGSDNTPTQAFFSVERVF